MEKPLLLIDVDGVISLFGFDPARPPLGRFEMVDGIAHFLSATAGEHLRELSGQFELVWCTGWEEKANEYLPLALGLPGPLPHVIFDACERPARTPTGSWRASTPTPAHRGRWRGSTTPTTTAARRGRTRGRRRPCSSPRTRPSG